MNEKLATRIQREKAAKTGRLDLSSLDLKEIPLELHDMSWLKELKLCSNEITVIQNLDTLSNLKWLDLSTNQITKIENLDSLTALQVLNLNFNGITELSNLEGLQNLQWLYLDNNGITEIKNLKKLGNLEVLQLMHNPITNVESLKDLVRSRKLTGLYLFGISKNNLNIPVEKFSYDYNNCLFQLRDYFESIKKGATFSREVPIIFVGNSTAGKTTLLHFIKKKQFPAPEDHSTHGIEPQLWEPPQDFLADFAGTDGLTDVQFYFWDFGGQEYYHATHRLFFSRQAVYVLLWENETNHEGVARIPIRLQGPNGHIEATQQEVELFPFTYWLDTIRFFVPDCHASPIILVQNKLDVAAKVRPENSLFEKFGITDSFALSVKNAYLSQPSGGPYAQFRAFLEHLLNMVKKHITKVARETHWDDVKDLLRRHKSDNIWTLTELLRHLQGVDADINESSMQSYAQSLCSNGFIFYFPDKKELKDLVFINPAWVTEKIYAILDDEVLKQKGEFDFGKVKAAVGEEYAPAFVALMNKFELIFENPRTDRFIAPQYLPSRPDEMAAGMANWDRLKEKFNDFDAPDFYVRFPDFMPRSIMLRFLAAYGAKAVGPVYWKGGIDFMLEKKETLVLYDSHFNGFKIFVEDSDHSVQRQVFNTLLQLSEHKSNLQLALNGVDFVTYQELKKYYHNEHVATVSGNNELIPCAPLRHFVADMKPVEKLASTRIKIFISYAHEDVKIKNLLVHTHLKAISNYFDQDLITWTDAEIKPGSKWDKTIAREINDADIIIFLVTNNFLASDYIKRVEMAEALKRFEERKQIILPVYIEKVSTELLPFKDRQYLPGGKPLKKWTDRNEAWVKIQGGIIALIKDIRVGDTADYFAHN